MRTMLFPLMAATFLAGCDNAGTRPIVATAGSAIPRPSIAVAYAPLLAECQARFVQSLTQSLNGHPVSYGEPETGNVGPVTTITLTAADDGGGGRYDYVCTFNGPTLVTAGRG